MNRSRKQYLKILRWIIVGFPIAAAPFISMLPLRPVYQQALIGVIFVWFQLGLLLGAFVK